MTSSDPPTSAHGPTDAAPPDQDMAEQAQPGHGIPSQDPDPAAQHALSAQDAEREADSVLVGGVLVAGAAVGAAVGMALAGPVGLLLGTPLGALTGALGGEALGRVNPPDSPPPADPKT